MKKEFVMRGKTASTAGQNTEVLNFSGYKPGYAYRLTEFQIYPGQGVGSTNNEMSATITAGKTGITPTAPDFNDEALIATTMLQSPDGLDRTGYNHTIINDTFLITQNLILMVGDSSGEANPVNWQCRFKAVKMSGPEEAATNYKQYAISDE